MRSIPEWIGKTDDTAVPPRVRLRVFEKHGGRCYLSGQKILPGDKWDLEHIKALCNGGEHRESNFAPALARYHKPKTKADLAEKSHVYARKLSHAGIQQKPKGRPIPGTRASGIRKRMNGNVERW